MNRLLSLSIISVAAILFVGGGIHLMSASKSTPLPTKPASEMVCITPHRIPMREETMRMCVSPEEIFGPHMSPAEIHLYANDLALEYRRAHPNAFDYPIGSKFEKRKYTEVSDSDPTVATIMERTGNTGAVSDWSFSIVSLPARTPLKQVEGISCAECHERHKDTGYVSDVTENALKKHLGIE